MQSRIVPSLTLGILLSGCFKVPVSSDGSVLSESVAAQLVESKPVSESKNVSTIDPNSTVEQKLAAPQTTALQGAAVSIPPGSLSIAAELVVEQAADFSETSITSEMGLADDIQVSNTSAGMIIRPTENVDLKKPLTLAMPLPASLGMRLADTGSRYAIFYKYFDPTESKLVTGMKVVDQVTVKLSFDASSGKDIITFEGYFGAYWAAILSREVKKEEVPPPKPAEEPIINVNKVSVIESTGIVKESEIIVKQTVQIPENVWQKPVLEKSPNGGRVARLKGSPSRTVSACKVDLYENPKASSGISLEAPLGPEVDVPIAKKTEHTLVGRFRCTDDQGRFTTSPWSESMLVPAVPVETAPVAAAVPAGPSVCGDTNYPAIGLKAYEHGALVHAQDFIRVSKCVYGADIYAGEGGSVYLSIGDGSTVCDLANTTIGEGTYKLGCHKAFPNAIGGNMMNVPPGNYRAVVDFSSSETAPVVTVSRIPCDKGDFYAVFSPSGGPDNPTFPAPTAENKMTHLGGCQFVYEKRATTPEQSITYDSYSSVKFMNATGNFSCGSRIAGGASYTHNDLRTSMHYENQCGSENRFFRFYEMITAKAHRFELSLGKAAQEWGNSATNSLIRYRVETSCPEELFIYGALTSAGQNAVSEVNSAHKEGACTYRFHFATDVMDPERYKFRIGNRDKTLLCGGTGSGSYFTPDCSSSALAMDPYPYMQQGKIYEVVVSGNGIAETPSFHNVNVNVRNSGCEGGLYMVDSISSGVEASAAQAFQEVGQCIFEKSWTPTLNVPGFYLANGMGTSLCGANYDPTRVPVLNGAEVDLYCGGSSIGSMNQIKPLSVVAGTAYKVRVDMRFRNVNGRAKVSVSSLAASPSCLDNVHVLSSDLIAGLSPVTGNKMTYHGDCTYSMTILPNQFVSANPYYFNFRVKATSDANTYGRVPAGYSLNLYPEGTRSQLMESGVSPEPISVNEIQGRPIRIFVKKTATATVTVQSLQVGMPCDTYSNHWTLGGVAGNAIPTLEQRRFQKRYVGNLCTGQFVWDNSVSNANFTIDGVQMQGMNTTCGLAPSASLYGTLGEKDVICSLSQDGQQRAIGNFAAGSYVITLKAPATFEDRFKVKVLPAVRMMNDPVVSNILRGSPGLNSTGNAAPNATPASRQGSSSWTDSSGMLWFFGGKGTDPSNASYNGYHGDLWKADPSSGDPNTQLAHIDGVTGINSIGDYMGTPATRAPSARAFAASWYDATSNGVYIFGGQGMALDGGGEGYLDDLWFYSFTTGEWSLLKGGPGLNNPGVYGSKGVASASNNPPPRAGATTWKIGNQLWMFGGKTVYSAGPEEFYNDIWKYDIASGNWTWMAGAASRDSAVTGVSTPTQISARANTVSWLSNANSKLYVYGGQRYMGSMLEMWVLDLASLTWSLKRNDNMMDGYVSIPGLFDDITMPKSQAVAGWKISDDQLALLDVSGNTFVYKPSTNQFAKPGTNMANFNSIYPLYTAPFHTGGLQWAASWRGNDGALYLFGGWGTDEYANWGYRNTWWKVTIP